ncbi:MAG: threonine synthase, partial [Burkholderiaceae bacterium]
AREGAFAIEADVLALTQQRFGFVSGSSSHAQRLSTIRWVHQQCGAMIDPHTADGVRVAQALAAPNEPMIVLETALPIKFAATINEALGVSPPLPAGWHDIEQRPKRVQLMANDVQQVKAYIEANAA